MCIICHLVPMMNLCFLLLFLLQKDAYATGCFLDNAFWAYLIKVIQETRRALYNLISAFLLYTCYNLILAFGNNFGLPIFAKYPSCNTKMGIKTNSTSFLRRNRSGHHNTVRKTWKHVIWQTHNMNPTKFRDRTQMLQNCI
jgi:hypothetical protein